MRCFASKVWQMIPLEIKNSVSFWNIIHYRVHVFGNKAKGWISKRVFQGIKTHQFFRKTNISYPLIRTNAYLLSPRRTCLRFWLSVSYLSKSLVASLQLNTDFSLYLGILEEIWLSWWFEVQSQYRPSKVHIIISGHFWAASNRICWRSNVEVDEYA